MSATRPPSFDERYAAPVEASRRGAHRARPNPLTSALPVVAGVAVVLLVVVGAWALLGNRGGGSGQNPPAAAQPSQSATPTTGSEVPAPSASAPSPSAPATGAATPGAEESEPAGEVDRAGTDVRVLNSVGVAGLAKAAADVLEGKDWGIGKVGDSKQKDLEVTRVYYEEDEGKATAEAIVADLGYGEIRKSPGTNAGPTGFTVVLGQDAADAEEAGN